MKKTILNLFKKKFVKNVIVLVTGTAGAQAIALLFSPLITRVYGPEAYGVMGAFTSLTNIIVPIAALCYPIAIVLPKNDRDAKSLIRLSLLIAIFFSAISLIFLLFFKNSIIDLLNLKEIGAFLLLIPLVIILSGFMEVMEQWLIRTHQYSINARVTFFQALIVNISKLSIGLYYPVASVLVIITAISNGIRGFMMFFFNRQTIQYQNPNNINQKIEFKKVAKKYYDFPLYRAPEKFLNAFSNSLPVLMLTAFFGPASAGFYAIGRNVLRLPSQLIGKAVGDVFYPRISQAYNNKENISELLTKAVLALSAVGVIPFGLVFLFGPELFSIAFGPKWVIAGEYARWLSLWAFFSFINRPSVRSLAVLSAQRFHLVYTIIMLITRLTVLAVGYFVFASDLIAVALFGISGAILNIGLIVITMRISRQKERERA